MGEVEVLNPLDVVASPVVVKPTPLKANRPKSFDGILNIQEAVLPITEEQRAQLRSTTPAPSDNDGLSYSGRSESSDRADKVAADLRRRRLYIASHRDDFPHDAEFNANLSEAREAIRRGVYPELIAAGSSGSYFVRDSNYEFLAVFKPNDEEPFRSNNPKWPKFFQRILCPCCFGRACLIPNNGYLSECAASIVDDSLKLDLVPKTRIVKLYSPTFSFAKRCGRKIEAKPKEGSYQLFVHGYRSATEVLSEWNNQGILNVLSEMEVDHFTFLFQKLCVLDYIIRNTDRHMDNWLIKHVSGVELKIAAIDNGLAFPVKHPESASRFRHFPFNWATLGWAKKQWNRQLSEYLLNLITPIYLHKICAELKTLFCHGINSRQLVSRQLRVFRGQVWNLIESLRAEETPNDLVKRMPILVTRKHGNTAPNNLNWNQWYRFKRVSYANRNCF
ncbi:Phosphatidylinositol 4-kinase type 2 [Aphelenchoides besseyi]|nr:Phosphatidylinositol 4-kinase type 2 [Aphelenchoides besseyi]KAI6209953.1 Phosphatidylinositol 4-kinase type 2 [Aphelenchoides besseyi]